MSKPETLAERVRRVIQRDLVIKNGALAFNSPPKAMCCICKQVLGFCAQPETSYICKDCREKASKFWEE